MNSNWLFSVEDSLSKWCIPYLSEQRVNIKVNHHHFYSFHLQYFLVEMFIKWNIESSKVLQHCVAKKHKIWNVKKNAIQKGYKRYLLQKYSKHKFQLFIFHFYCLLLPVGDNELKRVKEVHQSLILWLVRTFTWLESKFSWRY